MDISRGDIESFINNGKVDQVVAIIKSCTPNALGDLTVTLKDLSGSIPGAIQLVHTICFFYVQGIQYGGSGHTFTEDDGKIDVKVLYDAWRIVYVT
ncbi:hypothetical protein CTI12_AA536520 [Artemisia annua]|uniref:Homologous recombination OB-fold protein OB-fold domain-containing protein n=1 Tax=Artemisia annua TaxID=35608 RepID=A0A2U1L2U0_ARTAN|nr:hypothetical protein CTI12_AA536520 [Artemisia annua]